MAGIRKHGCRWVSGCGVGIAVARDNGNGMALRLIVRWAVLPGYDAGADIKDLQLWDFTCIGRELPHVICILGTENDSTGGLTLVDAREPHGECFTPQPWAQRALCPDPGELREHKHGGSIPRAERWRRSEGSCTTCVRGGKAGGAEEGCDTYFKLAGRGRRRTRPKSGLVCNKTCGLQRADVIFAKLADNCAGN